MECGIDWCGVEEHAKVPDNITELSDLIPNPEVIHSSHLKFIKVILLILLIS
jgi:hypothetical protein